MMMMIVRKFIKAISPKVINTTEVDKGFPARTELSTASSVSGRNQRVEVSSIDNDRFISNEDDYIELLINVTDGMIEAAVYLTLEEAREIGAALLGYGINPEDGEAVLRSLQAEPGDAEDMDDSTEGFPPLEPYLASGGIITTTRGGTGPKPLRRRKPRRTTVNPTNEDKEVVYQADNLAKFDQFNNFQLEKKAKEIEEAGREGMGGALSD